MALVVKNTLTFSSAKVILTDTTGDYDALDNPGGYGTPNPAFSDYVHAAIIRKKNVNEIADVVLTLDSYNPLTAQIFQATRDVDGWYEGVLLLIQKWLIGTNYNGGPVSTGDVVYDDGVFYYALTSNIGHKPSLFPSEWVPISDLSTVEENPSVNATYNGRVTAYDADVYWSSQKATLSQRGECDDCIDDKTLKRLNLIYYYIQNVLVADQLGDNTDGEWSALRLIKLGAKKKVT